MFAGGIINDMPVNSSHASAAWGLHLEYGMAVGWRDDLLNKLNIYLCDGVKVTFYLNLTKRLLSIRHMI